MVYLGVRPRGGTPGYHVNGRETFLTSVRLRDGWFRLDPAGEVSPDPRDPLPPGLPGFTGFTGGGEDELHPRWVAPGLFPSRFAAVRAGRLSLTAVHGWRCALVTRVPHEQWEATAVLAATQGEGRLVLGVDERHWYAVGVEGPDVVFRARAGELGLRHVLGARPPGPVTVSLQCSPPTPIGVGSGPDQIVAGLVVDDRLVTGPAVDGRYLSTEVAGGFTGRMLGMEVTSGAVDVLDFRYTPR